MEVAFPTPARLQMTIMPPDTTECNLVRHSEPKPPNLDIPRLLSPRNCTIINVYCFKAGKFGGDFIIQQ